VLPSPRLALKRSVRKGRVLVLVGTLAREATGRVSLTWSVSKRYAARATVRARNGTFTAKLRIPRGARGVTRASLTLKYLGDARFAPQTKRLTLHAR
jgi:hypothetical protein